MSSISIKPSENVYRKPYEFVSATVFALGAIGLLFNSLAIIFYIAYFVDFIIVNGA